MYTIDVRSRRKVEFIDITDQVQEIVSREHINEGICYLFVPHTTAGLTINENADPSVAEDIVTSLNKLFDSMSFKHLEGNSPGHIKSSLIGCSLNVFVENKKLVLGTWQGIYFCEFDGPRSRKIYLSLMPSK